MELARSNLVASSAPSLFGRKRSLPQSTYSIALPGLPVARSPPTSPSLASRRESCQSYASAAVRSPSNRELYTPKRARSRGHGSASTLGVVLPLRVPTMSKYTVKLPALLQGL
eukprot:1604241-Pleurochrysis_carterae.AAC.1